uniref:Uncharacterized protein n=1 Tax=Candidatus Kentrum sp. TC TaxID=2126339 RepID=A0A450ZHK1_9GAMM|nr:MAG: hypothetical protein BECKTC1821F_GA0114240_100246 [Candidatus Kentron sp. TC]
MDAQISIDIPKKIDAFRIDCQSARLIISIYRPFYLSMARQVADKAKRPHPSKTKECGRASLVYPRRRFDEKSRYMSQPGFAGLGFTEYRCFLRVSSFVQLRIFMLRIHLDYCSTKEDENDSYY